jgi:hypothetical protein
MFSDLWFRVRALFRRRSVERELDEELRFHVERQVEKYMHDGMSCEEATRRARIEFGGLELAKEECREARGGRFLEVLLQDVRFGLRMLLKSPAFTATAILALALGIGVNTTVFTAFDALALRPRPVKDPDHLVGVYRKAQGQKRGAFSYPDYIYYRDHSETLSDLAMFGGGTLVATPPSCRWLATCIKRGGHIWLSPAAITAGKRTTTHVLLRFRQLLSVARGATCGRPAVLA